MVAGARQSWNQPKGSVKAHWIPLDPDSLDPDSMGLDAYFEIQYGVSGKSKSACQENDDGLVECETENG